jgi:hypothetical protein
MASHVKHKEMHLVKYGTGALNVKQYQGTWKNYDQ